MATPKAEQIANELIPIKEEIMSKRILAVTLAFGILATSNAFASRARVSVLGTGDAGAFITGGSLFYDDARNIFYNPSYVNDFKNWGIIEKSNGVATGVQAGTASQAEGGFVSSMGSFNLGVYLNRLSAIGHAGASTNFANMRPLEVYFGGDMGNAKWGLGLDYASASAGGQSNTQMNLKAGAQVADFEPFGWITLIGADKIATGGGDGNKFKSMGLGLRYKMGEWIPYGGWSQMKITPAGGTDIKSSSWLVGLGRSTKIGEGSRMNYSVSIVRATNGGASAPTDVSGRTVIPVNVSVEADANGWLTARAGLSHNVYDRATTVGSGDASTGANTTGRLGFGIHVGKADLDFAVGKSGTAFARAESTELDAQVFDISNAFFSQASVSYHW
jgi:hypothetical protein